MAAWALTHEQYDERLEVIGNKSGCAGVFRPEENEHGKGPVITRCDGCGMLVGVSRKAFDAGPPATATSRMDIDDDADALESGAF